MSEIITIQVTPPPIIDVDLSVSGTGTVVQAPDGTVHIYNETPNGNLNGSNATFTSANLIKPGTLEVFLNGLKLKFIEEYNVTGNQVITLTVSPASTEQLLINYIKL